jgi:hypothetical protein
VLRYDGRVSNKMIPASHTDPSSAKEYGLSVLKGVIGAVPYVGTALNEIIFDARSRLKEDRLNSFFAEVAEEVERLSEESIDHDYLKSEEFSDLIEGRLRSSRSRPRQPSS